MDERAKLRRGYVGEGPSAPLPSTTLGTSRTGNPAGEEPLTSYRYLASILESMLDAVIAANPDGTIRTVNHAALELLGYAEEEIIGQPVGIFFEEEEFFRGSGLAKLVREGAARDVELTLLAKSGERIPVVFNGSVIREEDGRLSAVVGVARDIRERKRAEEEREQLLVAEHEQRLLAETLTEVALTLTSQTNHSAVLDEILRQAQCVIPCSTANIMLLEGDTLHVARWRGYEAFGAEELMSSLVQPLDDFPVDAEAVHSRKPIVILDTHQDPRWVVLDETAWIRSHLMVPICLHDRVLGLLRLDSDTLGAFSAEDAEGLKPLASAAAVALENARLYEAVQQELAERQRAEQLLRALNQAALAMERAMTPEEIFNAVAEELKKLGFSCVVFLTDENQSRLFPKYLSYEAAAIKALEKLTGLKIEDFSIPIETAGVYRKVIWEKEAAFIENVEDVTRQFLPKPLKRFAGQIVKMLKIARSIPAPLMVEDEVIGLLSVESDDLTEEDIPAITAFAHQMAAAWRKARLLQDLERSLEELKQTQAQFIQAQKMEAIGKLAGGVAHDFNNLLTAIFGYSQLLLGKLPPDDPRRMDAQEILNAARRAALLTHQLLAFSRQQMLQPQALGLNELVADTEKILRRLIGEDIELVTVLEPRLARVNADPGQMNQVIMNLAVNARDAMPEGGKLTIKTENVTLDEKRCALIPQARPGRFACLSVADTGVGMDEEIMQHLFEPFFTTKESGTGLGLPVVYGIVQQHEGWINAYSEPGQGSTFKVYLPAFSIEVEGETREAIPLQELQGGGEGILLVEDDEAVLRIATKMLGGNGYIVFEAATTKEALDIFEREGAKIHLVFSDVVLPDGTGLQLADQLLSRKGETRVLLSSGYSDDKSQWSVIRERGFRFIWKPYALPDLLQAIREAMEG